MGIHTSILKRCGIVLIVVGALDIAYMVWCVANGQSYSSSLNIFALVAGILLIRGSLRTARWVAMAASFLCAAGAVGIVVMPFIYPFGFYWAVLRNRSATAVGVIVAVGLLVLLFWIRQQLLRPEVSKAQQDAGVRAPRVKRAIAIGAAIPVLLLVVLGFLFHGSTAKEAIRRAEQQLGENYQYVVTGVRMNSTGTETNITAVVVAYKDSDVRRIQVQWKE